MTTIILSPVRKAAPRARGFTLVEVMISAGLGSFILAGVLSTFLFLGRSGANISNYCDMEAQARKALEQFAEDTRQASAVSWTSSDSVTLTVNSVGITYTYASGTFTRTNGTTTTLLTGVREPTATNRFFRAYNINAMPVSLDDLSTTSARMTADNATKQIQISLEAARTTQTAATATNIVLSARYVLRNKRVTA